jgi:hypothetical protein
MQFVGPSVKLGIFTEKACHDYHNVAIQGLKIPGIPWVETRAYVT